jgi:hypothetical protein
MRLAGNVSVGALDGGQTSINASARAGYLPFVLSPRSAVTFTLDSTISALTTRVLPGAAAGGANGNTVLAVRSELLPDWAPAQDTQWLSIGADQNLTQQDTLQVTLSNPLGRDVNNQLAIFGSISATSHAAPVPEPAGWAMLLAGAGLMGAIARRRAGAGLYCARSASRAPPATH